MTDKELTKKSKFLSLVLRHKPEDIGLKLDENGWTDIVDLCKKANIKWQDLKEVVEKNNKKRFEISNNGQKIRACQGHSIDIDLDLEPVTPPAFLYHGTATQFISPIMKSGLKPMKRDHVHLSATKETAINVGGRHGKPVVLIVTALTMHDDGYKFYLSTNGVWLTKEVPVKYILKDIQYEK